VQAVFVKPPTIKPAGCKERGGNNKFRIAKVGIVLAKI